MISKRESKFIKSLQIKKYRKEHKAFLVEGSKNLIEVFESDYQIQQVFCTEFFYKKHQSYFSSTISYTLVSQDELEKTGSYASNNAGIAIVSMKEENQFNIFTNEWVLVLDDVNDPGNLGTIIRIADWYGIKKIVCSQNTADVYNPKVISSSMGSFTRTQLIYTELISFFKKHENIPIYGAFLEGENVHKITFPTTAFLVMGNEANGISEEIEKLVTKKISIPAYGGAESLNVAIATAIILDNTKR